MKKPFKVILCTDGIFPEAVGGMQRHSRFLAEGLAAIPEIELVVIHPHKKKVFSEDQGITEVFIEGIDPAKNYLRECYRYSKRISTFLLEHPDAIIYSQGLSVWHRIKKFKKQLIINPHGLEPFQALSLKDKVAGMPFRIIFRYLFKHSSVVISLGGRLTDILRKNTSARIVVIPNAAQIPSRSSNPRKFDLPVKFLFVGRFAFNKGIPVLMNVIKRLNNNGYASKARFVLAGTGPLLEEVKIGNTLSNVEFTGFVPDNKLPELYEMNDVFVLPTLFEGMPTVVLEAMSMAMPVIVSDVGATAELVNSSNGYLTVAGNEDSLYDAILSMAHLSPEKRTELSQASFRKFADNFQWEKVIGKHFDLFREKFNQV